MKLFLLLVFFISCDVLWGYRDDEGAGSFGSDWDGGISFSGGQKFVCGWRTSDSDAIELCNRWILQNVEPFYISKRRLNGHPHKEYIEQSYEKCSALRYTLMRRVVQCFQELKNMNIDLRIDTLCVESHDVKSIFYSLNSPLTSSSVTAKYFYDLDKKKVMDAITSLKNSLQETQRRIEILEKQVKMRKEQEMNAIKAGGDVLCHFLANKFSHTFCTITTDIGSGSGFCANVKESTYIYTNRHVLEGTHFARINFLDGRSYVLKPHFIVEYGIDRDIVRFKIDNPGFALRHLERGVTFGEAVFSFGNSMGTGVITMLSGNIIGVGNSAAEVDFTFVPGNSGGPVILSSGDVIGMTTLIARKQTEWVNPESRFRKNRYFLTLIKGTEWRRIKYSDFSKLKVDPMLM